MNKKEFLDKLNQKLAALSQEERESAMKYYEDYFEDAGEEKEQEVISQLGSPEEIAKGILKENGKEEIEQEETNQEPINQERKINYVGLIIFILICIFFFPVIFPIFMTILGIAFGFMIAGIAILIAAVAVLITGIGVMFIAPFTGLATIGISCILGALGILWTVGVVYLSKKCIPGLVRGFVSLCKSLLKKVVD
jgi:hypothetical protein